jgi:outer membrane protein OmpA-like peptidoglycan-associated protein
VTGQPVQTQTQNPVGRPVGQPGTGTPPSQVTTTPPSGQKPLGDGGGKPGQQPVTQPVMQPKPQFTPPVTQQAGTGPRRLDDLRKERHEVKEGNRLVIREGGRTIIRENNQVIIRHNEVDRFRFNAREVRSERRGNEEFFFIDRPNGVRIINVMGPDGRLLRRIRRDASGREVILVDNSFGTPGSYFVQLPPPVIRIPRERYVVESEFATPAILLSTLLAPPVEPLQRRYTLDEIRYSAPVRDRMPRIDIDTVNFETGSWEVAPSEAQRLAPIANAMQQAIAQNPNEMFLIEGYTDAVGNDVDNLSLSDRRAESVAQVLTEQFHIPPENLSTQGYGEQNLKVPTQGPMRENRRVSVRRITLLLNGQQN